MESESFYGFTFTSSVRIFICTQNRALDLFSFHIDCEHSNTRTLDPSALITSANVLVHQNYKSLLSIMVAETSPNSATTVWDKIRQSSA